MDDLRSQKKMIFDPDQIFLVGWSSFPPFLFFSLLIESMRYQIAPKIPLMSACLFVIIILTKWKGWQDCGVRVDLVFKVFGFWFWMWWQWMRWMRWQMMANRNNSWKITADESHGVETMQRRGVSVETQEYKSSRDSLLFFSSFFFECFSQAALPGFVFGEFWLCIGLSRWTENCLKLLNLFPLKHTNWL